MQVQEFEKRTCICFAELEPELEIESVLTEVFRADKVKKEGKSKRLIQWFRCTRSMSQSRQEMYL